MATSRKTPYFTIGPLSKLQELLNEPSSIFYNLDRPIYNYIDSGDHIGELAIVFADKTMKIVQGGNADVSKLEERLDTVEAQVAEIDGELHII